MKIAIIQKPIANKNINRRYPSSFSHNMILPSYKSGLPMPFLQRWYLSPTVSATAQPCPPLGTLTVSGDGGLRKNPGGKGESNLSLSTRS